VAFLAAGARAQTPELFPASGEEDSDIELPAGETPGVDKPVAVKPPKIALAAALHKPGDLSCRNMTIESALFTISDTWNINVVTSGKLEGNVNCAFDDAPLNEILDAILLANGYSYRAVGESLVIQHSADVGSANPLFRSLTLPIVHSQIDEVVEGAQLIKSAAGQVKAMPAAKSVLVIDYPDRVESVRAFIQEMEAASAEIAGVGAGGSPGRLEVAYFHTHYIPAINAQQPLLAVLSPLGRVAIMPTENRILVVDDASNLEMAKKVLERIDRPRPQVRITALIYDLSLQDVEQLGVNWGSTGKGNTVNALGIADQALQFETTTVAPFTTGQAGGALTVRSLTRNFDINSVVLLLQTANDARLLADPNVTVMDNEEAICKSVTEIPYQQITQSELGGQIGTTAFKEAGVTLRVRPTIAGDGTIAMVVAPEFSRLAGFTPGENQPIIDSRQATTTVRVANRQTVVLSGLRQRSDTGEFNGIPFLKDVKYVGPLFRSRDTNVRESELIVFLMPEIVPYDDQPSCRQYQALETTECRLDQIPAAEGCGPMGAGCAATLRELPAVDELPAPAMQAPSQPAPPAAEASGMRPPYEARFRADGTSDLRRARTGATAAEAPPAKKSTWQRVFGS
jgi:general secretion pathway protein D